VSSAQIKDKFWVTGKVIDSAGAVKDVNVINLKTNKGTFTNDFGDYKIVVSLGDTVQFTSVNHQTVRRVVNRLAYTSEVLDIFMPVKTEELDEFELRRNDLDGYLSLDRKKTPVDKRGEALKKTMDFSGVDMRVRYDGDFIDQNVRPPVAVVDPTALFVGAGAQAVIPFKYSQRLWALRKNVEFRTAFPQMLISEFGEKFFENDLKIPKDKFYHFLEYCNPLGIENLYKQNRKIEMINILRKQSASYLKLIEDEVQED
jgi:hypothetical protein